MTSSDTEFDVIFAGGGASGCVIAGRLAAADPTLKILILESGPHTRDDFAHVQPARYLSHLQPESTTVKFYAGNKSDALGGRSPIVPVGQCFGGGSSVNFTMYTRAAASDFDDWETKYGNAGWGSKDLIPLLKKAETYQIESGKETHGYSGPLKVSYGGAFSNIGQEFLDVGAQYDPKRPATDDPNSLFTINAYGRWQRWIDRETGKRSDIPHHYIYNQDHKNLTIWTTAQVKRVVFEDNRAVGVEYILNPRFNPDASTDAKIVRAKRLVVISSGAFGSPAILERSGIGAPAVLSKNSVPVRVDLPGVGENYQDHQVIFAPYLASEESETLDAIARNEKAEIDKWSAQWVENGSGLMAYNALDAGVKIRPTVEELAAIGPEFSNRWAEYFADAPDKPVMWLGSVAMLIGDPYSVPPRKYFSVGYFVEYPVGTGHVHITSGEDVNAPPDFDTGYLTKPEDMAIMKWGYKRSREFARRMPSYRGEYLGNHPQFSEGSAALCSDNTHSVGVSTPDISYTEEDELAIEEYTRRAVGTAWHSLGTCAMKPREKGGVVDANLNVYGVRGLKVADLSIAPGNVSANTYSTAITVGEKAAVIIAKELNISGF